VRRLFTPPNSSFIFPIVHHFLKISSFIITDLSRVRRVIAGQDLWSSVGPMITTSLEVLSLCRSDVFHICRGPEDVIAGQGSSSVPDTRRFLSGCHCGQVLWLLEPTPSQSPPPPDEW
jgi:hypothetical protein